jgi:hypothetical protein
MRMRIQAQSTSGGGRGARCRRGSGSSLAAAGRRGEAEVWQGRGVNMSNRVVVSNLTSLAVLVWRIRGLEDQPIGPSGPRTQGPPPE